MKPVSQTKKHQGTSVMEQPRGQSFRKLMTAAVNLIVTVKKTEDILVSSQEILQVVSVLNTFKPLLINWEDFREKFGLFCH